MAKELQLISLIAGRDLAEIRLEKNSRLSVGECCPSGGGEDNRTGLLQSTSLRLSNLPRTGSAPTMREDLNRQEDHVVG
jgi:hypothetical protein